MDSCLSVLKPTELYGKGHPYHDLPDDEKIDVAVRKAIELRKERKGGPFPGEIGIGWNFGWTMFVAWDCIEKLEGRGIVATPEDVKAMFRYPKGKTVKEETTMASKKALQVFGYEGKEIRVDMGDNGEPRFVAADVCGVLELGNVTEALRGLDEDEKMTLRTAEGHSGTRGGAQKMNVVTESGLYSLILRSRKPEAKQFKRWITHEVLPSIRKTGEYATPAAKAMKADKSDELARKRVEIMDKNADWRMAKLILEGMNVFGDVMTPESKTVFMAKYGELVVKHDFTDILPKPEGKWYSATDIASEHGTNKARIGRISNDHDLKAPEGQSNEYGTWIRTKSKYSDKEVMGWVYSEKGREWFTNFFAQPAPTGTEGK
jgi:prophage antirepressor-like protein